MKIGQANQQIPGQNIIQAIDTINQAIYTALATDPLIGVFAKAIPPPPKISAVFKQAQQQVQQQTQQLKLPFPLIQLPLVQPPTPPEKKPEVEEGIVF